jgi:hypothetical protein
MPFFVSPELYRRHRDEVIALTTARQRHEPGRNLRGLTDAEIAEKLRITPEEVTEIRCIAELDLLEADRFFEADAWKEARFAEAHGAATSRNPKPVRPPKSGGG